IWSAVRPSSSTTCCIRTRRPTLKPTLVLPPSGCASVQPVCAVPISAQGEAPTVAWPQPVHDQQLGPQRDATGVVRERELPLDPGRQTDLGAYYNLGHERLRPVDFDTLTTNRDYAHVHRGFFFDFGYFKPLSLGGEVNWGTDTNFDTAVGPPVLAKSGFAQIFAIVRPVRGLIVAKTYLLTLLRGVVSG